MSTDNTSGTDGSDGQTDGKPDNPNDNLNGTDPNGGADGGDGGKGDGGSDSGSEGKVDFKTYEKVLNKLKQKEREEKERELAAAKKRGDWQKVSEQKDQELAEERRKRQELEGRLERGQKLNALLGELDGDVDEDYFPLFGDLLEDIGIDEQSGLPEKGSVQAVAEVVKQKFGKVITPRKNAKLPNDAARGGGPVSMAAWKDMNHLDKKKNLKAAVEADTAARARKG